jgi:hypothetical protein
MSRALPLFLLALTAGPALGARVDERPARGRGGRPQRRPTVRTRSS